MIESKTFGDVHALHCSWPRSRLAGYSVYAYAVRGVLIDTGFPGVAAELNAWLDRTTIRGAYITHHHEDHAGNLALLVARGLPVAADPRTLAYAAEQHRIPLYRHITWATAAAVTTHVEPFEDTALELVPTPGHSADHQAVWDAQTGTLFAGDLYLGTRVRVAHLTEDPRQLLGSLRAAIARDPARVFCSHRGLLPDGASRLRAKADWLADIIGTVDAKLHEGWSDRAIRRAVLGSLSTTHWISGGAYSPNNMIAVLRRTQVRRNTAR